MKTKMSTSREAKIVKKTKDFINKIKNMTPAEKNNWKVKQDEKEKKAARRREIKKLVREHGMDHDNDNNIHGWRDQVVFESNKTLIECDRAIVTPVNLETPDGEMYTARRNYKLEVDSLISGGATWDYKKSMNKTRPLVEGDVFVMAHYRPKAGKDFAEVFRVETVNRDVEIVNHHIKVSPYGEDVKAMTLSRLIGTMLYSDIPKGTNDKVDENGHFSCLRGTTFKKVNGGGINVHLVSRLIN